MFFSCLSLISTRNTLAPTYLYLPIWYLHTHTGKILSMLKSPTPPMSDTTPLAILATFCSNQGSTAFLVPGKPGVERCGKGRCLLSTTDQRMSTSLNKLVGLFHQA